MATGRYSSWLRRQAASLFIFRSGRRGKLLRHAVDGAEAEDEIAAVNRHDFAPREKFVQGVQGDSIVGIIEYWNEYKFVCDIKVCIAGREALFVEKHRRGHRQRLNAKRLAVLILHRLQQREIFLQRGIVGV